MACGIGCVLEMSVYFHACLPVGILVRFLATRELFGDRLERHPFFRQQVQLLHLVGSPGLAVAFDGFGAHASSSAGMGKVARISIASGRPLKSRMSQLSPPIIACASGADKTIRGACGTSSSVPTITPVSAEERPGG